MLGLLFIPRKVCLIFQEQAGFHLGMFIDMFHKPQTLNRKKNYIECINTGFFLVQRPKEGKKEEISSNLGEKPVSTSRHISVSISLKINQMRFLLLSCFFLFCFFALMDTFTKFKMNSLAKVQNCNFFFLTSSS